MIDLNAAQRAHLKQARLSLNLLQETLMNHNLLANQELYDRLNELVEEIEELLGI